MNRDLDRRLGLAEFVAHFLVSAFGASERQIVFEQVKERPVFIVDKIENE